MSLKDPDLLDHLFFFYDTINWLMAQAMLGRQGSGFGRMMEHSSNDKIPMSNKIQNPNVKMFSDMCSYFPSFLYPNLPGYRKFELLQKGFFGICHLTFI